MQVERTLLTLGICALAVVAVVVAVGHLPAHEARAVPGTGTLFGTDASGDHLLTVNPVTGAGAIVGGMFIGSVPSLAVDPATGTIYAGQGGGAPNIYTVDKGSGAATLVGDSGLGLAAIGGMDFAPDGTLYAAVNIVGDGGTGSDHLATINKATGAATVIGPFGACPPTGPCTIEGMEGIAFDASSTLWGAHSARGAAGAAGLYTINPATGAATFVAPIADSAGAPSGGVVSIQFACDGTLYGGSARAIAPALDGGFLGTINAATGLWTFVGAVSATGGSSLGALAFQDPCPPAQFVLIDIKPGGEPNVIDPTSQADIPVAILSTADFDARTQLDLGSLTFGRTGDEQSLAFCPPGPEDVNRDGLFDEVCKFTTKLTGFQCNDTQGILRGNTKSGVPIEGRDSVRISPSACPAPTPTPTPTPVPGTATPLATTTPTASTTPTEGPTPTITGTPPPPAKGNDDFAGAVVIAEPLPYSNKQDTAGATLQLGEPRPCAGIGRTVWYSFTPSTDLVLTADTLGSNYDTALAAYTGTSLAALNTVACNDDFFGLLSRVEFVANAGVTYHFQVGGFFGSSGNLVFNLAGEPPPTPTPTPAPCETPGKVPFDGGCGTPTPTPTPTVTPTPCPGCPEMSLNVKGLGVCDDPVTPTKCTLEVGRSFTLSVEVVTAPVDGYVMMQTFIDYGTDLIYNKATAAVEIVWPDAAGVILSGQRGPTFVNHSALTGLLPPLPVSTFTGNVVELSMTCSAGASSTVVELIPLADPRAGGQGAGFVEADAITQVPTSDTLTINCGAPLVAGLDTDGDGCTNAAELQTAPGSQTTGGLRDPLNPWDFYDVNRDGTIDVPNDLLQVILAYLQGPLDPGGPGSNYTAAKDRGPPIAGAQFAWNRTGPDGHIDVPNDLLPIILQYLHSCK